jgi:hypothetical protein
MATSSIQRGDDDEAARIRRLKTWPRWPWLPVKRNGATGTIFADDIDGPVRVFDVNVFHCSMRAAAAMTLGTPCPWPLHGTYPTVEAMLADGWRVD